MKAVNLVLLGVFFTLFFSMCSATLYESYTINDEGYGIIFDVDYFGQQFTIGTTGPNETFSVDDVKILSYVVGTTGTLNVNIYTVDGLGHPTGSAISTGSIDSSIFTTDDAGIWYAIPMTSGELSPSTQYVVVFSTVGGDFSNYIALRIDYSGATYGGGHDIYSVDSGATWDDSPSDSSFMFEINGTAAGAPPAETAFEYYEPTIDSTAIVFSQTQIAQNFIIGTTGTNEDVVLNSFKAEISKAGTGMGDLYVELFEVDIDGFPVGYSIGFTMISELDITTTPTIIETPLMDVHPVLLASTEYVLKFYCSGGDVNNYYIIGVDSLDATYPGGNQLYSSDGGVSWVDYINDDILFKLYGTPKGTSREYLLTGEDGSEDIFADYVTPDYYSIGQTFTVGTTGVNENFDVSMVRLKASANGTPTDAIVGIKATDISGLPTGDYLSSGYLDGLNLISTPEWVEIGLSKYELQAGTEYVLVIMPTDGTSLNNTGIEVDFVDSYAGGNIVLSFDNGISWMSDVESDLIFDIWGYSEAEDLTPPTTTITSIAGDTTPPYIDEVNDNATTAIIAGEVDMLCRWGVADLNYTNMDIANECSIISSDATCAFGNLLEGTGYLRYVSCKDSLGNEQTTSQNLDISFDVDFAYPPTLTSVDAQPDPIKGGDGITITPSGQGDDDSDALYYYCDLTSSPTSSNTDCTEGNTSYSTPYAGMTCNFNVPTDDTTYTYYCRTYDGVYYSAPVSTNFTTDSTPPSLTITSVEGDVSAPYVDTVDNNSADLVLAGETGMECLWSLTDQAYGDIMVTDTCTTIGSDTTCVVNANFEQAYTYYVACKDSLGNEAGVNENTQVDFTVVINDIPLLTSVSAAPDPIKGGSTVTFTPTGQADEELETLYYYCDVTSTPTSANTDCSEGNAGYPSPYAGMTCTFASETDDATHTHYCRTFNGVNYSLAVSDTYTTDSTAPNTTITSIGGDTTSPYVDVTNDNLVNAVIAGETDMVCRWATTDLIYSAMVNDCSVVSSNATCSFGDLTNGAYTRFVSCNDSLGNAQTTDTNLNLSFDVDININPVLTSISILPEVVKGGNTITVTPEGISDYEDDVLNFYCAHSANPTSITNECTQGNVEYTSPYSEVTCTMSSLANDSLNSVACRVFDSSSYSADRTNTYTSDSTAPIISVVSVANDSTPPYRDYFNDDLTSIIISGETNMTCRWGLVDAGYSSMVNNCSVVGSDATCNIYSLSQGNYTRFVSCNDYVGNANTVSDNLNINFDVNWNEIPTISEVIATSTRIIQGENVNFEISWFDVDGDNVKSHVCKTNEIIGQSCVGGAFVEDSIFGSTTPINLVYETTTGDFGLFNYYIFVCDENNLCSVPFIGAFAMEIGHDANYVSEDIPPISIDVLGSILAAFVFLTSVIGIALIIIWIRA